MKLAMVGLGQAGGKIVDEFLAYDRRTGSESAVGALAVNTARADLLGLEHVPDENRVLIGESRVKGHGVGADNELGAQVMEDSIDEVLGALDVVPIHRCDGFLVVAALGGGTGSGGAPVLARQLRRTFQEPVYGLGVLPATNEGGIYSLNAARSFQTFVNEVDNLLTFDNDAWRKPGESVTEGYDEINDEIARRFGLLFEAGEVDPGDDVAESVVDSSEIINTLAAGGVSTVGYASEPVESERGLLSRLLGSDDGVESPHATNRITTLVRKATLGRLTLPCEVDGVERALLLVAGPPSELSRKGVERGRRWLEDELGTRNVRGGDYPVSGADEVAAVVLLAGVKEAPRIEALQRTAAETQENIEALDRGSEERTRELARDEDLEPLF